MQGLSEPTLLDLLKAGVHFGHRTFRWHPKMKPYIFTTRDGVHIFDLGKTQAKLKEAVAFLTDVVSKGGKVLLVGTKRQAREIVKRVAAESGQPYVSERWLGGTLTNFATISKQIENLADLMARRERGELSHYTKREQLEFDRTITRLSKKFGGLLGLTKLPDALFIFDAHADRLVIREATRVGIPVVAITDTNVDPSPITYVIPANDDAVRSLTILGDYIRDTILVAQGKSPLGTSSPLQANRVA